MGSKEAVRPSQPVCRLHMLREGQPRPQAVSGPRGRGVDPCPGSAGCGPNLLARAQWASGVLGSLALGGPDPGRVQLLGGADSAGGQGCQGTLRCRKRPARPRSPFCSLLPGTQPRLAGIAGGERSGGFLTMVPATGPPERPWGRPAHGGTQALVGACRHSVPTPWSACSRRYTYPDLSPRKGEIYSI